MVHVMLFPMTNILYFTLVLSEVCEHYPLWLFLCSLLMSCFPDMLLRYFLNDFDIVSFALTFAGVTFVFTSHRRFISIVF
jgi:hypothetical protein